MIKHCFKCGEHKPSDAFYKHPQMGDGYLGKCKECTRTDVRKNRESKRDYYNEYDGARSRRGLPRRLEWARKNKEVVKASKTLANAIKDGIVKRMPCQECGNIISHGHHENYSKPLEVLWLCQRHHRLRHFQLKESGIDVYKTAPVV